MKKKIYSFLFLFFIILFIWKDYKKIDFSYVNQSGVTYDVSNVNNIFLKRIHENLNKFYEIFLVKNFSEHKNYWILENEEDRKKLPNYKIIKPEFTKTLALNEYENTGKDWSRSHGNETSNRFSSLDLINNFNAKNLEVAWVFESEDGSNDIQANPVVVNGIIYTPVSDGSISAIDGTNGNLIWKSKKYGSFVAKRGLLYKKIENAQYNERLYFSNRERLICIDAKTGKQINSFGKDGDVRTGLNVLTPVIYNNQIIIATWDRSVEVYDLNSGKKKWKIKYKKNINKRVGGKKYNNKGANPWGGISLDRKRGLLFLTTGNPHPYFDGTLRPGNNLGSNSVISLDLNKKKILWSFQETSHDIWNLDLPAPPILTSITLDNKIIDVVITPTKKGNTLILDRLTGRPVFEYKYRKAPVSKIRGEKTNIYQPYLDIPEPFSKNEFLEDDFWSHKDSKLDQIKKKYTDYKYGFYATYELGKKNLQYNFHGGAEWMGASIDHKKNKMYLTANNIPWETSIRQVNDTNSIIPKYVSEFQRALNDDGYPITKPPWGTLTSMDLNTGKIEWQKPFGEYEELIKLGLNATGTENFGGVTGTEGNVLFATGTLDKNFYVYDSINGDILFKYKLDYIGSAPPTTYIAGNKQFIIVHSTGGSSLKKGYPELVENGNKIFAFTLN